MRSFVAIDAELDRRLLTEMLFHTDDPRIIDRLLVVLGTPRVAAGTGNRTAQRPTMGEVGVPLP